MDSGFGRAIAEAVGLYLLVMLIAAMAIGALLATAAIYGIPWVYQHVRLVLS